MVQRALPEKVWQVSESCGRESARGDHLCLVPCPSHVYSGAGALSGYRLGFWIVLRLSDAKIWKYSRFYYVPCWHGYSHFLSLSVVHIDMTHRAATVRWQCCALEDSTSHVGCALPGPRRNAIEWYMPQLAR